MLKSTLFIITSSLLVIFFSSSCYPFDDGDFQYWNTESASWKINDAWKVKLEEEFRFGDDASDFYYQHSDLGAAYSGLADWLEIGFNHRHIFEEKEDEWRQENRPHLNATVKFNLGDFSCSNRGRFEYRNREDAEDFWRYRNKITVKFPFKLTRFNIQPYIADEIFADFDQEELNRNRLYTGFALKLPKNLKTELYYLWQTSKKSDAWEDYHILGNKVKLSF